MIFRDEVRACPACGLSLLQGERNRWRCDGCKGVMVPVRQLADDLTELAPSLLGPERMVNVITRSRPLDLSIDPPSPRCCPLCRGPMERVVLAAIPLDRCYVDESVWFDGKELDELFARAREQDVNERGLIRRILNALRL